MEEGNLAICRWPGQLPAVQVDELIDAFQIAMCMACGKVASIRDRSRPPFDPTRHDPVRQLGLVLSERYKEDRQKIVSILLRVVALEEILQDQRIKHWSWDDRLSGEHIEVDEAVFELAAMIQLNDDGMFDEDTFFSKLSRRCSR